MEALLKPRRAPDDKRNRVVIADCGDVAAVLGEQHAGLVVADPPWMYGLDSPNPRGSPSNVYGCIPCATIAAHLDAAWDVAADDTYLLLWATWPVLAEVFATGFGRWRYLSGGTWTKWNADGTPGAPGIGYHWRGDCEPLLMLAKGKPHGTYVRNADVSPRGEHSEKPVGWLAELVTALAAPGVVLELYGGLGTVGRACKRVGRESITIEIDPERAEAARALIAQERA